MNVWDETPTRSVSKQTISAAAAKQHSFETSSFVSFLTLKALPSHCNCSAATIKNRRKKKGLADLRQGKGIGKKSGKASIIFISRAVF